MLETPALFCTKAFFNDLSADVMTANVQDKIYVWKSLLIYTANFFNWPQFVPYFQFLKKDINIVTLILQPTLWWKVCIVERFYFIRIERIRSCQKWLSKAASIAVAARWTVRVAEIWITIVWRAADMQVMTSSKCRTIIVTTVCGMPFVIAVLPCLIELYRCPTWPVYQRE